MSQRCEEMLHPVIPVSPPRKAPAAAPPPAPPHWQKRPGRGLSPLCWNATPGVNQAEVLDLVQPLGFDTVIHADDCALDPEQLDAALERDLTDDRVFGILTVRKLADFFLPDRLEAARRAAAAGRRVLVYGVGATLVAPGDLLVYADITRWELQLRFRRGGGQLAHRPARPAQAEQVQARLFCRVALGRQGQKGLPAQAGRLPGHHHRGFPRPAAGGRLPRRAGGGRPPALPHGALLRSGRLGRRLDEAHLRPAGKRQQLRLEL